MRHTIFAAILSLLASASWAGGDPAAGKRIAERWCESCHVGPGTTARDTAPTLINMARRHKQNRRWVYAWLTGPHPPMTGINLSQQEIADIMAYLDTLPTDDNPQQ